MTSGSFVHDTKRRSQTTETAKPLEGSQVRQAQYAVANPTALTPANVRILQRTIGNRAVQRLLRSADSAAPVQVQPRLRVRPLHDRLEAEADQRAGNIVHPASGDKNSKSSLGVAGTIQTKPSGVQVNNVGAPADPAVEQGIRQERGRGRPLAGEVRTEMEQKMGADFGAVRIHTDAGADRLNRALDARAFTTGKDIFFKQGEYQRDSRNRQALLAHELVHVQQQSGAGGADAATVQRKSDKLPQKAALKQTAKSGTKLFGTTIYTKIMRAIYHYHTTVADDDHVAQLQQLIAIHGLLAQWQVSHGAADRTKNKDTGETARRGVLNSLRTDYLPREVAAVYQQAKTAGDDIPIMMWIQLMDIMRGLQVNMTEAATIMADGRTALHTYKASGTDVQSATETLGTNSAFMKGASINVEQHTKTHGDLRNEEHINPTGGAIPNAMLNQPISQDDSEGLVKYKNAYKSNRRFWGAMQTISPIEYMAIAAYTDEGGYNDMNALQRGTWASGTQKARKQHLGKRKQVQQANLMAMSALNRLPDWDGSPLYRGEGISWIGNTDDEIQAKLFPGAIITLPSFTSTSANRQTAEGFSAKGGRNGAVWEIEGITHSGKDISKMTVMAKGQLVDNGYGAGATEDEVLLKPFTQLRIISAEKIDGKWRIQAEQA